MDRGIDMYYRLSLLNVLRLKLYLGWTEISKYLIGLKPGIHFRQRQAEAWRRSLSSASVDGVPSRATCLRGCHDPSHRMSVDQSEASLRNGSPHTQFGRKNWVLFCIRGGGVWKFFTVFKNFFPNLRQYYEVKISKNAMKNFGGLYQFLKKIGENTFAEFSSAATGSDSGMPRLAKTKKHYLVCGAACRGCRTAPRFASTSNVFPA